MGGETKVATGRRKWGGGAEPAKSKIGNLRAAGFTSTGRASCSQLTVGPLQDQFIVKRDLSIMVSF